MTIEEHAEMILQAAGTSLRHYTMCKWRDAILAAVRAVYEDGELAGVRIGKEAALAEVDQQRKDFASPEYATPQPIGSLTERFACSECFNAIDILNPAEVLARHGAKPDPLTTWPCPIKHDGCVKNCGSYGCGN